MDWKEIEQRVRNAQEQHAESELAESELETSVAKAIMKLDLHNDHMFLFLR